jgi:hypothetical protein
LTLQCALEPVQSRQEKSDSFNYQRSEHGYHYHSHPLEIKASHKPERRAQH